MTVFRLQSVLVVTLAMACTWDAAALAQDQPARGTVKVRSRFFNPFEVGQSRLTINPFGVFTVTNVSPFVSPTVASPAGSDGANSGGTSNSAVVSPQTVAAPSTASAPAAAAGNSSGGLEVGELVIFAVRPPFRPPERSPWRPPPRTPFIPP
jgi:hypothetical protein